MKICSVCKIEKSIDDFYKHIRSKDGLMPLCKVCDSLRGKNYRLKNKDDVKKKRAERYIKNKDAELASSKKWSLNNADKHKALSKRWVENNPEHVKERARIWIKANPDFARTKNQNRRARKKNSGGKLSKNIYQILFELQKGCCAICKAKLSKLRKNNHLDHIIPLKPKGNSQIGRNTDDNIQLLCISCNSKKSNHDPIDYMQSIGFLL